MPEDQTGLRVVDFPSIVKAESVILGAFSLIELLVVILISAYTWFVLKGLGSVAIGIAGGVFAFLVFLKVASPEEVGFLFPLYEIKYGLKKTTVYSHEFDTSKNIPSLETVDGWAVKLKDGYAAIIAVQPVNFFYSTPSDQRAYIDSYKSMLNSLDFPIQVLSIASEFDINRYMNRLITRFKDPDIAQNPVMREVVDDYIRWLDRNVRIAIQRQYFIVVTVLEKKAGEGVSLGELRRRAEVVISGLLRGGITARILERDEILQLYELIFYRKNTLKNYNSSIIVSGKDGGW